MIIKLILERYVPLMTSGIKRVELDTQHLVNLFISKNGTGKTSILKELNPLAPENGNFDNGRKYYEEIIGDNHYILDSYTGQGNGHSFKVNGKELNTGGTYMVQNELVATHFHLNSALNRVLSGLRVSDLFSSMSPGRRKDIIMQIYPNNTDYALGVWNKLRTERNDLKGAIKQQILRYTEEQRKLQTITDCGVDELENRIKLLDGELRQSLLVRGKLESVSIPMDLADKVEEFNRLTETLTVNKIASVHSQREVEETLEMMVNLKGLHQEQASVLKRVISEHAGVLEGLEEFLADPEVFKGQSKQIGNELIEIEDRVEQYNELLSQYPVFNDPDVDMGNLILIEATLTNYLNWITLASNPGLTGAQFKGWTVEQEQLANQIRQSKLTLSDLEHQINHYERAETVECPDCHNTFKVGMTPQDLLKMKASKENLIQGIERFKTQLENLDKKVENDREWFDGMNRLYTFVRECGHVPILGQLIREYDIGKQPAARLINALNTYKLRFELFEQKELLLKEQNLLETRIGLLDRNNVLDVATYVASTEKELAQENNQIVRYQEKIDSLKRQLTAMTRYKADLARLVEVRDQIMSDLADQGKVEFRVKVDDRISMLTSEKDEYMSLIIKNRSLTAVVSSISADIDRMKRRLSIVEVLMDGLCPNKGVIGKLMGDFIKTLCANINAILHKVWDTPLFVMPCAKANGDLTYKFPVVKNEGKPAPDIEECSAGEKNIIDWAFRVVVLSYHPSDYPLIMDEVGINLDEIKRGRFFNYVQDYTQQKSHRQLFLVSHYIAQQGLFKDPNIVGLRYDGLTIPGVVNQHSLVT